MDSCRHEGRRRRRREDRRLCSCVPVCWCEAPDIQRFSVSILATLCQEIKLGTRATRKRDCRQKKRRHCIHENGKLFPQLAVKFGRSEVRSRWTHSSTSVSCAHTEACSGLSQPESEKACKEYRVALERLHPVKDAKERKPRMNPSVAQSWAASGGGS